MYRVKAGLGALCCAQCMSGFAAEAAEPATLPTVEVQAPTGQSSTQKYQLPVTTESLDRAGIDDTVNMVTTDDAFKYLPSISIRKRNNGDTQSPMATRTSGLGQSARSLIYADGVLLSALIGNNNTNASPRWGMVSPEDIARIDVMYGPFSAAYPGNSVGVVAEITTRMPTQFESSIKTLGASQDFDLYGTHKTFNTGEVSASLGNRIDDLSWRLSINHLDSQSQPLTLATASPTASAAIATVTGGYTATDRNGKPILVFGAGGMEHKLQDTLNAKLAYDVTPGWQVAYTAGVFQNNTHAQMQNYLTNAATGAPLATGTSSTIVNFGGTNYSLSPTSLSNGMYTFDELHLMQALSLKSNTQGEWDWEAIISNYDYLTSDQRAPGNYAAAFSNGSGNRTDMSGTGWSTLDLKSIWRPEWAEGRHQFSFGYHYDRYMLSSNTYSTSNWQSGSNGSLNALSKGKTETQAVWSQDAWKFAPDWKLTLGGRYEQWRAFDGYNFATSGSINTVQPDLSTSAFSPKASLAWAATDNSQITASLGKAYRFPTVSELYQMVTTGTTLGVPNPNLRPERALSAELAYEYFVTGGKYRVSLFQENLSDALISSTGVLGSGFASFVQNVDSVRSRGVEITGRQNDVLLRGLELSGSVTYVNSVILSDPGFLNSSGIPTNIAGKQTPNIPTWRATMVATYRPDDRLAATVAGRYSGRVWSTLDNSDINANTYTGFSQYFVVDTRLSYKFDKQLSGAIGIDNLNNRQYFLYHPFPQRTVVAELRVGF
ncbi:MAG TPA: TonB-dependent receptor [Rhodocyclaceae bacterium]|nr:TonB-dependent receptor [Rhodocyclaceae bacterium]